MRRPRRWSMRKIPPWPAISSSTMWTTRTKRSDCGLGSGRSTAPVGLRLAQSAICNPQSRGGNMRHRKAGRKFGRDWQERKALFRQQAISLILNERITTTEAKAKSLRPIVEKLITMAREDNDHNRKVVIDRLVHKPARDKLFDIIGPRYE